MASWGREQNASHKGNTAVHPNPCMYAGIEQSYTAYVGSDSLFNEQCYLPNKETAGNVLGAAPEKVYFTI